jgi:AraC family transcriptional regulator of arabinose operon
VGRSEEWTSRYVTWKTLLMPRLPALPVRDPSAPTRLPFRIRTLGRVRAQPYHATAGTYHDDAMLTVVRAGRGLYCRGGDVQQVTTGFVGLVLPSSDPGLLMADPEAPYDHYFCRFAGHEALRMARAAVTLHDGARFFSWRRWPEAVTLCESMLALERQTKGAAHAEWMSQTEGELAALLSLFVAAPLADEPDLREATLRRYLTDHISEPFDLDTMARHFRVSRFHLSRKGRALLGEPLGVVSRRLRLELSRSLLDATLLDLSVGEVARRVGFEDPLYFSKVFRRSEGMSPSEYRQSRERGPAAAKPRR